MKENRISVKDITTISIGIAALIGGGIVVYQLSAVVPIPGTKYLLMAPYLSMIVFIIMNRVKSKYAILYIGIAFGLIMSLFNLFMTIAIISTAVLSYVSMVPIRKSKIRKIVGASLFSAYTGLSALSISKYMIGGVFERIKNEWILVVTVFCWGFGVLGVLLANKILEHMKANDYEMNNEG